MDIIETAKTYLARPYKTSHKMIGWVSRPFLRDTTQKNKALLQVALYTPCTCGSGKKFKFCCYKRT